MNPIDKQFTEGEFTWFGLDFLCRYGDDSDYKAVVGSCGKETNFFMRLKEILLKEYETY